MLAHARFTFPFSRKFFLGTGDVSGGGAESRPTLPLGRRMGEAAADTVPFLMGYALRSLMACPEFLRGYIRRDADRWALRRLDHHSRQDLGAWRVTDELNKPWWRE